MLVFGFGIFSMDAEVGMEHSSPSCASSGVYRQNLEFQSYRTSFILVIHPGKENMAAPRRQIIPHESNLIPVGIYDRVRLNGTAPPGRRDAFNEQNNNREFKLLGHVVINNKNGRLEECFKIYWAFVSCHKWSLNGHCFTLSLSLLFIICWGGEKTCYESSIDFF